MNGSLGDNLVSSHPLVTFHRSRMFGTSFSRKNSAMHSSFFQHGQRSEVSHCNFAATVCNMQYDNGHSFIIHRVCIGIVDAGLLDSA